MAPIPTPTMPGRPVDARLVAVDMDGTLVGRDGRIPTAFWPLLERMEEHGILLVPASGRQYATLRDLFGDASARMGFIAENGTLVALRDEVIATQTLNPAAVRDLVTAARDLGRTRDLGVVVCGVRSAYIERTDAPFRSECDTYYHALAEVEDLTKVEDGVLKVSIFDFEDAQQASRSFAPFRDSHQVVVSGRHWIDMMSPGVHKGAGLDRLRTILGLRRDQCVAFGDYHNDLEMLAAAGHSFAMADGHPDVLATARYVAPANAEDGVITVLEQLLT